MGYHHFWWHGNQFADRLANQAAESHAPEQQLISSVLEQMKITKCTLRHHVAVASHLAPQGGKPSLAKPAATALVPKGDKARQLAKAAGHCLNAEDKCVACGLVLPLSKNLAFIECALNMKCMGKVGASFPGTKLFSTDKSCDSYLFGTTKVHASHTMATHYHMQLHFCTFCGAHGHRRSKNLQKPCPKMPTKAGMEAIRLIAKDVKPDVYKQRHVSIHGKQIFGRSVKAKHLAQGGDDRGVAKVAFLKMKKTFLIHPHYQVHFNYHLLKIFT